MEQHYVSVLHACVQSDVYQNISQMLPLTEIVQLTLFSPHRSGTCKKRHGENGTVTKNVERRGKQGQRRIVYRVENLFFYSLHALLYCSLAEVLCNIMILISIIVIYCLYYDLAEIIFFYFILLLMCKTNKIKLIIFGVNVK